MRALRDGFIIVVVFVGLLVGSVFACDAWDASFYAEAKARLISATPVCRLRWTSGGRPPVTRESDDMPCDEARRRGPPEHAGVIEQWEVSYDYVSPLDQARHVGAFRTGDPLYGRLRAGAEIDILAHKREAGKSRERALLD
jgi:hypothetical protein